jgi:hypothetical protein
MKDLLISVLLLILTSNILRESITGKMIDYWNSALTRRLKNPNSVANMLIMLGKYFVLSWTIVVFLYRSMVIN